MSQSRENLLSFYFNPRPREEGDGLRGAFFINGDISIHALVKRATAYLYIKMQMRTVDFNPRPREEGDQMSVCLAQRTEISIHALVKRATKCRCV